MKDLSFDIYRRILLEIWVDFDLLQQSLTNLLIVRVVLTRNAVQYLDLLVFRVIPFFDFFQDDAFLHVLILIDSGEDMSSVNHHPPKPFVGLLHFSDLPYWCADLRCHVLFLLDDVFLA